MVSNAFYFVDESEALAQMFLGYRWIKTYEFLILSIALNYSTPIHFLLFADDK
jgi:hypothetical protein